MEELKTKVDVLLLKTRATIEKKLSIRERYVYCLSHEGTPYILKGYKVCLVHLKPGDQNTRERFMNPVKDIVEVYHEYFFAKIASRLNLLMVNSP